MPLLLPPDHQTTQPKLSRDRSTVKSEISFKLILSGMGGDVWRLGLQLCIAAVLLCAGGRGREFPGSLSCLNNYVTAVSCTWVTEEPVGHGPFHLHFTNLWSKGHNASCKLTARDSTQNRYHCTIHLASQILETDGYRVSLQGNFFGRNHMYIIFPEYNPCKHSKYEQGSCGLRLCPAAQGRPDMLSRKGISKTTSENNGNKAECPPWRAHCVGCISKNAGPVSLHSDLSRTSERAGALEHLSSTLLICIMFSCAMDNIQLDCLYGCFFS
ncbi:uncharacterized protein LOC106145765 isoform X1 [Columba livia]|uniref:uncharacterized protein LOC106145765 isoform X1 n=1 Tax=Columba livia TaxID=8932 RepID=UPI0031BB92B8